MLGKRGFDRIGVLTDTGSGTDLKARLENNLQILKSNHPEDIKNSALQLRDILLNFSTTFGVEIKVMIDHLKRRKAKTFNMEELRKFCMKKMKVD